LSHLCPDLHTVSSMHAMCAAISCLINTNNTR